MQRTMNQYNVSSMSLKRLNIEVSHDLPHCGALRGIPGHFLNFYIYRPYFRFTQCTSGPTTTKSHVYTVSNWCGLSRCSFIGILTLFHPFWVQNGGLICFRFRFWQQIRTSHMHAVFITVHFAAFLAIFCNFIRTRFPILLPVRHVRPEMNC